MLSLILMLMTQEKWHRALWQEAENREELKNVFLDAPLPARGCALSVAETEYLNRVILFYQTSWRIAGLVDRAELELLSMDAGEFFSLPRPRAVWEKTKRFKNPYFIRFVERALKFGKKCKHISKK